MQKDTISYLKKYIQSESFKKKYKDYLDRIDIQPTDYGEVFSIEITPYQDGYMGDEDDTFTNKWLYELQGAGVTYINDKYKAWKNIMWNRVYGYNEQIYVN